MYLLQGVLRRVGPWPPALVALAGVLLMAVVYAGPQGFNQGLDAEFNAPAFFSAAVLLAASVAAVGLASTFAPRSRGRRLTFGFAAFVLFFAVDELYSLHERVESFTGVDWQKCYLPVGAAGALVGLGLLHTFRHSPRVIALLMGGGAAWLLAQVLEAWEWKGSELVSPWMIYPEELLEVIGSGLFVLAMLVALRSRPATTRDRTGAQEPVHAG